MKPTEQKVRDAIKELKIAKDRTDANNWWIPYHKGHPLIERLNASISELESLAEDIEKLQPPEPTSD